MRIAHFLLGRCNPDSANGVDKTVYFLSREQRRLGNHVSVFSLTAKQPLPIDGVTVYSYAPEKIPFTLPRAFLTDLNSRPPDVVHMHSVYVPQNWALARWLRKRGIPYIVTPNGGLSPYLLSRRSYLKIPYRRLFELPLLNNACFIHAVADADDIRRYGARGPIVTAPNGIDLKSVPREFDDNTFFTRIPETRGKKVFLFVGRLDPWQKGLDLLLRAFAVARENTNTILVLVGPDWNGSRSRLERMASELQISSKVVFLGPVFGEDKFNLLAGADVFIHTSRWEAGIPFSVLEACAMRKPCLLTVAADPTGRIQEYECGIAVLPELDAIASAFEWFAKLSPKETLEMGNRAYDMVRAEFRWDGIAQAICEAYGTYGNA